MNRQTPTGGGRSRSRNRFGSSPARAVAAANRDTTIARGATDRTGADASRVAHDWTGQGSARRHAGSAPVRAGAGTGRSPWWQAAPLALVFLLFLAIPIALVVTVSFWQATSYELVPDFTLANYLELFEGCGSTDPLCVTFRTWLSTLEFSALVWAITLVLGYAIAYFLAFQVRTAGMRSALFILCTLPFWTSSVIRMISWMPLLGRDGLVNQGLTAIGVIDRPLDWLLFSDFSVVLAFVHLYTLFMIVPVFNSMMRIDRTLLDAARDAGASGWQVLAHVIWPLSRNGILIGSTFVIAIVMGDFVTIGLMGGPQTASVGRAIQVQTSHLQFPIAAANAVILLAVVLMFVWGLTRRVDIRKEL